jgi:hypothetical protein
MRGASILRPHVFFMISPPQPWWVDSSPRSMCRAPPPPCEVAPPSNVIRWCVSLTRGALIPWSIFYFARWILGRGRWWAMWWWWRRRALGWVHRNGGGSNRAEVYAEQSSITDDLGLHGIQVLGEGGAVDELYGGRRQSGCGKIPSPSHSHAWVVPNLPPTLGRWCWLH